MPPTVNVDLVKISEMKNDKRRIDGNCKTCRQDSNRLQIGKTWLHIYCNGHKKLGKVGIVSLVQSVICETEDYTDDERKHLYSGCICGSVTGYENYEFIFVEVYDIKISTDPFDDEETAIQTGMLIWAKELK